MFCFWFWFMLRWNDSRNNRWNFVVWEFWNQQTESYGSSTKLKMNVMLDSSLMENCMPISLTLFTFPTLVSFFLLFFFKIQFVLWLLVGLLNSHLFSISCIKGIHFHLLPRQTMNTWACISDHLETGAIKCTAYSKRYSISFLSLGKKLLRPKNTLCGTPYHNFYYWMHVSCFSSKKTVTNIRLQKPVLDFNTELVMAFLDNVEKILLWLCRH